MPLRLRSFFRGLQASLPIAAGYLPIAFSFGLVALASGLSAWQGVLVSLVIYAGASQFVLASLVASGAGALALLSTVLVMNLRHVFYGAPTLARLWPPGAAPRWPVPLLGWGLTDEVFVAAQGRLERVAVPEREDWYLGLQLGAYATWVGGTVLGVSGGRWLGDAAWLQASIGFVLPALFLGLVIELWPARAGAAVSLEEPAAGGVVDDVSARALFLRVAGVSLAVSAAALTLLPSHWALLAGMLAGAASSLWGGARRSRS
ncbi:AzlC family ABC transporter permease [Amphibiibacter pelophylacis]|uniref:AzlC family ABC transporter permease n=1 Tax=Amphibiibacter pelophylacis TaxID=1799477 RepID=A0ACC6NYU3_9BURK